MAISVQSVKRKSRNFRERKAMRNKRPCVRMCVPTKSLGVEIVLPSYISLQ